MLFEGVPPIVDERFLEGARFYGYEKSEKAIYLQEQRERDNPLLNVPCERTAYRRCYRTMVCRECLGEEHPVHALPRVRRRVEQSFRYGRNNRGS